MGSGEALNVCWAKFPEGLVQLFSVKEAGPREDTWALDSLWYLSTLSGAP